jgi:RNA polymerase sigma-70 factor (ECF subfamily)
LATQPDAQEFDVAATYGRACARWRAVQLPLDRFVAHVVERNLTREGVQAHAEDLLLAFACAEGDVRALAAFETNYLSQIPGYVGRFKLAPHLVDEVAQKVRMKLLVGASPGLARYAGQGPLQAFVRVTAVRVAVDVAAAVGGEDGDPDGRLLETYVAQGDDPELATFKNTHRDRFRALLEECLAALAPDDKALLRFHLVERLNIDQLSTIYRAHRATLARRLVRIRTKLLDDFRDRFAMRWGASPSEVRSLVRVLQDEIHLSAERLLR